MAVKSECDRCGEMGGRLNGAKPNGWSEVVVDVEGPRTSDAVTLPEGAELKRSGDVWKDPTQWEVYARGWGKQVAEWMPAATYLTDFQPRSLLIVARPVDPS